MSPSSQNVPVEILTFCERCSEDLVRMSDHAACISYVRSNMPQLLAEKGLFADLMRNVAKGAEYPDMRRPTVFDNEVVLYVDDRRIFSLRMYLWGPGETTYPHDHNSWGVIGTVSDGFEAVNYRRDDDGTREGYARLSEVERIELPKGETVFTLPFNEGIHKTGNPTSETIITLHLYGRSQSRGYLQGFDIAGNRVFKVFPQRLKKAMLAAGALESLQKVCV
jgi:predicted metal-dependent enzyme (double-stranded beta helix superfamily)